MDEKDELKRQHTESKDIYALNNLGG
jgi:hypothetical protein